MSLPPGTRLGVYEIDAQIGEGGMGQVFRATDTKLKRQVAIKILPDSVAADHDRLARFQREAEALASLNHPHIAAIYGLEESADTSAIVMELVDGEDLSQRIALGALPPAEALVIARQVAEAVEAAHAKGIVHRDLKPANIKITTAGVAKVLDFGLAKAIESGPVGAAGQRQGLDLANSPTFLNPAATERGVILGTAAYMSPQQARGQVVGKDADIWAFGCVLFEMLTGHRPFKGETTTDVLANVLHTEPDWSRLPAGIPPAIERLLRRCLAKEPARRVRDIADARLDIEDALAAPSSGAPVPALPARRSHGRAIALAALLISGGVAAGVLAQRSLGGRTAPAVDAPAAAFGIDVPQGESLYLFANPLALSPDGRQMTLITNGPDGRPRLYLRGLDDQVPKRLEAADGATFPFWSPDGRSLAFYAQGELRVMDLASRSVRTLVASPAPIFGGAWNRDGTILFADMVEGLKRMSAAGGAPVRVPSPGPSSDKFLVAGVQFLPDGRHFIYFAGSTLPGHGSMMLGNLDSLERTLLLKSDTSAVYAPPGFLIYIRDGDVVAHRFDPSALALSGEPVVIARNAWVSTALTALSASDTAVLAFAAERTPAAQLTWFDRAGKSLGQVGEPGRWVHVSLSPDGKAVAAERLDERTGAGVTWTMDTLRGAPSRLSLRPGWTMAPTWSPHGDQIFMGVTSETINMDLIVTSSDGSSRESAVVKDAGLGLPTDWLPDGSGLVFSTSTTTGASDIMTIALAPDSKPKPIVQTPFNEAFGKVSPDGRWLAYASNESGREEVYVRQLAGGGRWRVSQNGGSQPRWRRDSRELFFVSRTARLMAAAIAPGTAFDASPPTELPIETEPDLLGGRYVYDVADDGKRFLVIRRTTQTQPQPISMILNWHALLRP